MISNKQINILTKAFPHMPPQAKLMVDVLLKTNNLMESVDHISSGGLSTCDTPSMPFNLELLLRDIRPVCDRRETEYIDAYLNLIKTRTILNAYHGMNGDNKDMDSFASDLFKNTKYDTSGGEAFNDR